MTDPPSLYLETLYTSFLSCHHSPDTELTGSRRVLGIKITLPEDYDHFVDNRKPDFLSKFPNGMVPAWEGDDGFKLFEGAAIARYLASSKPSSGLLGSTIEDAASIEQWSHLAETEVAFNTDFVSGLCSGKYPYNKNTHNIVVERQVRALTTMNEHLSNHTFFVGERITLADLAVAAFVQKAVGVTYDAPLRIKLPHLIRHLETIVNQPALKSVYGEVEYVDKALQYAPTKSSNQ